MGINELARQIELERSVVDATVEAWKGKTQHAQGRKEEGNTDYGMMLKKRALYVVAVHLEKRMRDILQTGKAGAPSAFAPQLRACSEDVKVMALIALNAALDGISLPRKLGAVALDAGARMETQVKLEHYKKEVPRSFGAAYARLDREGVNSRKHRRTVLTMMANRHDAYFAPWPKAARQNIGLMMLEAVKIGAGIIDYPLISKVEQGKSTTTYWIMPTTKTAEFLAQACDQFSLMQPRYLPTIIRPKRWTSLFGGGYWSGLIPLELVKDRRGRSIDEMVSSNMAEVLSSVNHIQDTAWKINVQVLRVMEEALERGVSIGALPQLAPKDVPAKPVDILDNPEALRMWKHSARLIHDANKKRNSQAVALVRTVAIAKQFEDEPEIFFPHTLDWRGRAYPAPVFLNPQAQESGRALLTFAQGKPLGNATAAGWLAIAGANAYGVDKVSLEERIGWVEESTDAILAVASDPWAHRALWEDADSPWMFLAFCYEWSGFQAEGYDFVSCLPVALDGSCNGLQNMSALLRDEVGGKATNLIPGDSPEDIYQDVADLVIVELNKLLVDSPDPGTDGWLAAKWLEYGVTRKLTKNSCMTYCYSSTEYACRETLEILVRGSLKDNPFAVMRLVERGEHAGTYVNSDNLFNATLFLQGLIWKSLKSVVVAAAAVMGLMQKLSGVSSKVGVPLTWVLPDGFMVSQVYVKTKSRRVQSVLEGSVITLQLREHIAELDKPKCRNGASPNFIHSLDAYALRSYVNLASAQGITSFGMIHDSFSTVAADADLMGVCIRESFAAVYEGNDFIQEIYDTVSTLLDDTSQDKMPSLPSRGKLDIGNVRHSDYFFA